MKYLLPIRELTVFRKAIALHYFIFIISLSFFYFFIFSFFIMHFPF